MEQKEIIENNILLAKFLTRKVIDEKFYSQYMEIERQLFDAEDYRFDMDWNWLMTVVERIEQQPIIKEFKIAGTKCVIYFADRSPFPPIEVEETSKIESVYKACVLIANWYNTQNK